MLHLPRNLWLDMVAHALERLPLEACGLLAGPVEAPGVAATHAATFTRCTNVAGSSKLYTVDPKEHLRADRAADDAGLEIIGVMHSHTHTDAYPSPTDVAQAPDPTWHYVIVSLRDDSPSLRSYRIIEGEIIEESVVLVDE